MSSTNIQGDEDQFSMVTQTADSNANAADPTTITTSSALIATAGDSLNENGTITTAGSGGSGVTEAKFLGQKDRRKSSSAKMFLGDYLSLANNENIKKILAKNGDISILFSDIVIKINKRNKMQERILLITDCAVYNIDPSSHKVKRRIELKEIGSVSLSKLPDNFFCLHVPSEYDYLLVSNKKTEIVSKLLEAYEKSSGVKLSVNFGNTFDYKIDTDVYREILFSNVEGGISTQIFTKKKKK